MMGTENNLTGRSPKEDRRSFKDVGFMPGSVVQWQCANNKCSQQLIPSSASLEGKTGYHPSSGFQFIQSTDAKPRSTRELPSQKGFIIDWQGRQPVQTYASTSWGAKTTDAALPNVNEIKRNPLVSNYVTFSQPKPMSMANAPNMAITHLNWANAIGGSHIQAPFVTSTNEAAAIETPSKDPAKTSQMTIFYAGEVSVYDNISSDKARELMSLAANESNVFPNATNMRQKLRVTNEGVIRGHANINQAPFGGNVESQGKEPPSPISVSSHFVGCLVKPDNAIGLKIIDLASGLTFHGPSLIKALPMARKASLARFLVKRRERLANAVPYSSAQKSPENAVRNDLTGASKKSEQARIVSSCSREPSSCWNTSQHTSEPKSPNTKLEM